MFLARKACAVALLLNHFNGDPQASGASHALDVAAIGDDNHGLVGQRSLTLSVNEGLHTASGTGEKHGTTHRCVGCGVSPTNGG